MEERIPPGECRSRSDWSAGDLHERFQWQLRKSAYVENNTFIDRKYQ
jgi:hypothetical protein